jgi:SAM-dependent MidA family methyltransferase
VGYYRHSRQRVGRTAGTDFYTATSSPVFGELVVAACTHLLAGQDPRSFLFVEIGAEIAGGVLGGLQHPFASATTIRLGQPIALEGPCVVFSNELFDAQPFHRFVFREGAWRELGVQAQGPALAFVELPTVTSAPLPATAPEGYIIDAPLAATALLAEIAARPWHGLFVAADYGKSWRELTEATPHGTARAYHRHTQSNDLLARPGEQDLTCHVCWDWLAEALTAQGFENPQVVSQESFFIHHAAELIAAISTAEAARFSPRKLGLMQLLHPANMGQKFQVLHSRRRGA